MPLYYTVYRFTSLKIKEGNISLMVKETDGTLSSDEVHIRVSVFANDQLGKMSVCVFCPVPSPPVPMTGLLSSISVFKQDKVTVHITGLSPPASPSCHSPGVMKAPSFCLKTGDKSRTVVRDQVGLTDQIRVAGPGERGTRGERRVRMFLPNWIRSGGEGKVYVEQGSVCLFILQRQGSVGSPVAL